MSDEHAGYPVFYSSESAVKFGPMTGVSAQKPQQVADRWRTKFGKRLEFFGHGPIEVDELAAVHSQEYVEDVLTLKTNNGFGSRHPAVPRAVRFTNGGVLTACRTVLDLKWMGACAPYSGFHHAGKDFGGGFCTFNGLAAAAYAVLDEHLADSVLILDCDYHYGNGTQDILDRGEDLTASIFHWSAGQHFVNRDQAKDYLEALKQVVKEYKNVDLVIYQAGADQHRDDPLGGLLTNVEMRERDQIVFDGFYENSVPVVWTLAGGYQRPVDKVLALHDQTMREALRLYEL